MNSALQSQLLKLNDVFVRQGKDCKSGRVEICSSHKDVQVVTVGDNAQC